MEIKGKFKFIVTSKEWLYIILGTVILILIFRGDTAEAISLLKAWLKK